MEQKKVTKKQIEKRMLNAIVFIPSSKDDESIFFSDKGLRITVTNEYAVIATGFHRHVFDAFTASGISRPWLYSKRLVEIALENDCLTDNGYSFAKLLETLKAKENQSEYNVCVFTEWWMRNCFSPLYSIGETTAESFSVYIDYVYNIAKNSIVLSEKTEDMTNKAFVAKLLDNLKEFTADIDEQVIFPKKTDEELLRENMEAAASMENEGAMKEMANDKQDND